MPSKHKLTTSTGAGAANATSPLLQRIRNMWEFANLCQWIYIFGKAAKIDEALEIEDIETECLKPASTILPDIALALLKLASSHRGLTHEILDDQLRKEYIAKAPTENPLGDGETTWCSFSELDAPTKITILQRLTQWIMSQPERLREKMDESRDIDQTSWRIEPYGWDGDDRTYYVLDDNRVYRLSEAPEPPNPRPKSKKTYGTSRRSGKRRHTSNTPLTDGRTPDEAVASESSPSKSSLGGLTWECVAVTLDDVRGLVDGFQKTRDANEKILRNQLDMHLLPILEKQEESRKRKEAQHQRELLSLAKMANAKRSSRIAGKIEQQKEEEKIKEEQERARKQLETQHRDEQKRMNLERERDFRLFSREKRLKERAARRRLHEEELAQLSEDHKAAPDGRTRMSDRQLQSEIDRNKRALEALEEEDENWTFDCVCGLYGQVDDGAHSVACERCNVWQHSNCVGIKEAEADRADFHFICGSCKRQMENASTPRKTVIKLKIKSPQESMRHASGSSALQVSSLPRINGIDLGASASDSEDCHDTSKNQPDKKELRTTPKAVSVINGNQPARLSAELQPTFATAPGNKLTEQVVSSVRSSQDAVHTRHVPGGCIPAPHVAKSSPQEATSITTIPNVPSLESLPDHSALPGHGTSNSTILKTGQVNGLPQNPVMSSPDQSSYASTGDLPTEDQNLLPNAARREAVIHSEHAHFTPLLDGQKPERMANSIIHARPLEIGEEDIVSHSQTPNVRPNNFNGRRSIELSVTK
ncbi:hypothetical protein PWT90_00016 [Aphanocladium album]|nr:hypothetical protein PWT90_00016 [Aphanocladium album]